MTNASNANFFRPGAVDLSGLASAANTTSGNSTPGQAASYSIDVTEAEFEKVATGSMRYPVIMVLHSPRDKAGTQMLSTLDQLASSAAGKWLLARVNVDTQPRIAQALGVQAVPTVIALLGGQAAPLFQGTKDAGEISTYLDQVVQVAAANGLTGRVAPTGAAPAAKPGDVSQDDEQSASDPRFVPADEAMARGDFEAAVSEFDKLLKANPRDAEAQAGRAQAALLGRTAGVNPDVVNQADAKPTDLELALQAADVEVLAGQPEDAFARLIAGIKAASGDERERLRTRLLELFETLGKTDPAVQKARRELSLALF